MGRMVTAGRVSGLFGAKGELSLTLYDDFPREPNLEEPVFVKIDSHTVPLFFTTFARRGQRGATVLFADIDTESRAAEFIGLEFYTREYGAAGEETDEELYFEELVGWDIEIEGGGRGRITAFLESEFNPLFEIEIDGGTELIPAQDDFIVEVDERRRKIVMKLPEGLLGLNK